MNYFYLYSSFLKKFYFPNPDKKLRVVFDCLNNPTSLVLKRLFKKEIQEKRFKLIAVRRFKADLGVIFDFDGDRAFFVDNKSRFVQPEAIARLLIWQLKPKKVIIDVTTGWQIKKLTTYNLQLTTSKVGHFFVKKLMREKKADFGAEHSGHYYFALRSLGEGGFYYDSGILAAIEVINAVSRLPYKLSDFVDLLPQYYRSEINIKLSDKRKAMSDKQGEFLKKIENSYKLQVTSYKPLRISHLDGLTMEFADWWFNLRFSQTEPLLRLNVEAVEKSKLQEQVFKLKKLLSNGLTAAVFRSYNTKNVQHPLWFKTKYRSNGGRDSAFYEGR